MSNYGTLGIIPARGGSIRVPRKNIRSLGGKPLIAYTIEAANSANQLDRIIVSTDDEEIAEVARSHGADVPFMRPTELATEDTPDAPVFIHALNWLGETEGFYPELLVNLRPTTPFKTGEIIDDVIRVAVRTGADVVRTVTRTQGVHHPYWMFSVDADGFAHSVIPGIDLSTYYQSQSLPSMYRLNGVVDAMRVSVIESGDSLSTQHVQAVEVSELMAVDIDTELDFRFCELLLEEQKTLFTANSVHDSQS